MLREKPRYKKSVNKIRVYLLLSDSLFQGRFNSLLLLSVKRLAKNKPHSCKAYTGIVRTKSLN
jgi:hypothetical protein